MGRAIDLFVTYRFIKLLVTPFEKQEAYKLGIIDKDGKRTLQKVQINLQFLIRLMKKIRIYCSP